MKLIRALRSGAGLLGNGLEAAHGLTLLSWPLCSAYKRDPQSLTNRGDTHIHLHHAARLRTATIVTTLCTATVRRPEFVINDDDCRAAISISISITHTTPASESAACGGVPASASQCHATDVVAVEHFGVDSMAPILLAGNSG